MDWLTIFGRVLLGIAIFCAGALFLYLCLHEKKEAREAAEYYKRREKEEAEQNECGGLGNRGK